jgi:hypothetical protein
VEVKPSVLVDAANFVPALEKVSDVIDTILFDQLLSNGNQGGLLSVIAQQKNMDVINGIICSKPAAPHSSVALTVWQNPAKALAVVTLGVLAIASFYAGYSSANNTERAK